VATKDQFGEGEVSGRMQMFAEDLKMVERIRKRKQEWKTADESHWPRLSGEATSNQATEQQES
jgi:Ser/Thr protein kinase RdoA (MazF antagonist)